MTKSYPYNIVVTRDVLVVEKMFFDKLGRTSFFDAFSRLNAGEKEDSLIVSPRSNNNFISLDVDFPAQVAGEGTKYVLLKLLETSKLLEYFSVTPTSFETHLINRAKLKKALTGADQVLDDAGTSKITPKFYLSFGMGDDMREWSGPYALDLVDANISITSDGVRELELMFTPTMESLLAFTNKLFDDYQYAQSDSIFDTFLGNKIIIKSKGSYKLKDKLADKPEEDWNYCIRDIVGNFISDRFPSLPRGNILVLIPDDFNTSSSIHVNNRTIKLFGSDTPIKPIGTIDSIYKGKLKSIGIDITLDDSDLHDPKAEPRGDPEILQEIVRIRSEKLDKLKVEEFRILQEIDDLSTNWVVGLFTDEASGTTEAIAALEVELGKVRDQYSEIYDRVKFTSKNPKRAVASALGKKVFQRGGANYSNPDAIQVPVFDPKEYKKFILSMGDPINPKVENKTNTLLVIKPLYNFIKGVYDSFDRARDFTILEENDAKILKLLKKYGLIENANEPVIIFGRLSIIKGLMYPTNSAEGADALMSTLSIGEAIAGLIPSFHMSDPTYLDDLEKRAADWANVPDDHFNDGREPDREWRANKMREARRRSAANIEGQNEAAKLENWISYINDFIETFKPKTKTGVRTSSFGEGLGDYEKAIMQMVKKSDSPPLIFTHNIKNSNVLSLSFDSSPYKEVLMNYSMESAYKVMDAVFTKEELLAVNTFNMGPLKVLVDAAAKEFSKDTTQEIIPFLRTFLSSQKGSWNAATKLLSDSESDATLNTFIYAVLIKAGDPANIVMEGPAGRNSLGEADILRRMNKSIINVDIKTLPFFNTAIVPGRKCVLFGKPNLIRGAAELRGKIEEVPAFFTNSYQIIGYKHRITSTDAFSEFKLIQDSWSQGLEFRNMKLLDFYKEEVDEALGKTKTTQSVMDEVRTKGNY